MKSKLINDKLSKIELYFIFFLKNKMQSEGKTIINNHKENDNQKLWFIDVKNNFILIEIFTISVNVISHKNIAKIDDNNKV